MTNPHYWGSRYPRLSTSPDTLGTGNRTGTRGPEGDVDLVESVSYLRGKHAFKFGFEYIDVLFDGNSYSLAQGNVVFTTLQNFLQGVPNTGTILLGDETEMGRSHWYGGFFQDDWRVKSRVTLNLGLRYEYTRRQRSKTTTSVTSTPMSTRPPLQPWSRWAPAHRFHRCIMRNAAIFHLDWGRRGTSLVTARLLCVPEPGFIEIPPF